MSGSMRVVRRLRRPAVALLVVAGAVLLVAACGSSSGGPLPSTIERQTVGQPTRSDEPCGSWISPGIDAAFCDAGIQAPAPSGSPVGQIRFTGTPRNGAEGGSAKAA